MDSSGRIYSPELADQLRQRAEEGDRGAERKVKQLMPISEFEANELRGMNRAQRRAFYSNNRRKRPRFGGEVRNG